MDLRKIAQERGLDGVLDALQPLVDQLEDLTKPAPIAPIAAEEAADEDKGEANG